MALVLNTDIISEIAKHLEYSDLTEFLRVNKACVEYAKKQKIYTKTDRCLYFRQKITDFCKFLNEYSDDGMSFYETYNTVKLIGRGRGKKKGESLGREYIYDKEDKYITVVEFFKDLEWKECRKIGITKKISSFQEVLDIMLRNNIDTCSFDLSINSIKLKYLISVKFPIFSDFITIKCLGSMDEDDVIKHFKYQNYYITPDDLNETMEELQKYLKVEKLKENIEKVNKLSDDEKKLRSEKWKEIKHELKYCNNKYKIEFNHVQLEFRIKDFMRKYR